MFVCISITTNKKKSFREPSGGRGGLSSLSGGGGADGGGAEGGTGVTIVSFSLSRVGSSLPIASTRENEFNYKQITNTLCIQKL